MPLCYSPKNLSMLVVLPQFDSVTDVPLLPLLRSAAEQDHEPFAVLTEVNSVARSKINGALVNASVEWSQVNLDARTIRLEEEQTKGDEARTLPLPSVLANMLTDVTPKSGRVFDGTNLRKAWVTACAASGLGTLTPVEGRPDDPLYSGLTLHDLRRSAVRNLVNAGVPERVAMKITGHRTRSVFDRYHIVSPEDVTNAMQMVETASLTNGRKALGQGNGE
jgi:hypothetical protein